MKQPKVLVYGIGNPGRQDDALGILLVDKLNSWIRENGYSFIQTDQNYQLNIEDADAISGFDLVIFVDASVKEIDTILMEEVTPDLRTDFSMHSVEPSFVVGLCQQMFQPIPQCFQLHIRGYEFRFMEDMTAKAKANLEQAFVEICQFILHFSIDS